jgi:hypothetical protein
LRLDYTIILRHDCGAQPLRPTGGVTLERPGGNTVGDGTRPVKIAEVAFMEETPCEVVLYERR